MNARSLINKRDEIEVFVKSLSDVGILLITETWFKPGDAQFMNIQGFTLYNSDRVGPIGGGVAVYVKDTINIKVNSAVSTYMFDILCLTGQGTDCKRDIILVYNSNSANLPLTLRELECVMSRANRNPTLIFGDFNVNLFGRGGLQGDLLDLMSSYGFQWLNTQHPTRESSTVSTCIDHIFSNSLTGECNLYTVRCDISDHNVF